MSKFDWLNNAVIYNIYPQSFMDSNGDGIGDLNGLIQKLDYIEEMGFSAIWLNPIYESPFKDAGYDISDFYKVAPRYGTNNDFRNLCFECNKRNIRVIMDLVAGHTSTEHEWFKKSSLPTQNEYTNRYVWTDSIWDKGEEDNFISGWSDRDGCFLNNFFYCQPALNYGYKEITRPWQLPMDHPDCLKTREELLNIMDFWMNLGASGFRVDMASSLVKGDPDGSGIRELWQYLKTEFTSRNPYGFLIAEWGDPSKSIPAGFDVDFMLQFNNKAYTTLFRYEEGTNQTTDWVGNSYFRSNGKGDARDFFSYYMPFYEKTKDMGYISIPTGNHDMPRLSMGRDMTDLKIAYTFLLTMPGIPAVYYGDEIGMRYVEGLCSKEGGFNRTGARTPMQWCKDKNLGFSEADQTYISVDSSYDAPTVEEQLNDENSLINYVKTLINLRKEYPSLWADADFKLLECDYPLVYLRDNIMVVINPKDSSVQRLIGAGATCIAGVNARINNGTLSIWGKGAAIIQL